MRVAFLVVALLVMTGSEAGHTRATDSHVGPALIEPSMTSPVLTAAAFSAPALTGSGFNSVAALTRSQAPLEFTAAAAMRTVAVPQVLAPDVNLAHAPMAGRGAALIQPLTSLRPAGQPARSMSDHLLTGLVAVMLIAYQLRRKHRVLRPHPFGN